jgi:hypothetical protein
MSDSKHFFKEIRPLAGAQISDRLTDEVLSRFYPQGIQLQLTSNVNEKIKITDTDIQNLITLIESIKKDHKKSHFYTIGDKGRFDEALEVLKSSKPINEKLGVVTTALFRCVNGFTVDSMGTKKLAGESEYLQRVCYNLQQIGAKFYGGKYFQGEEMAAFAARYEPKKKDLPPIRLATSPVSATATSPSSESKSKLSPSSGSSGGS